MTPTQARAFLAVAMKGSFSEAARSLNVSQPTITNQIKQIERRHEVELFYRTGRGASLTQVGEALLPFIKRMFGSFEEAITYLDEIQGIQRGHLRIGSYGPYDVIRLIARYSAQFTAVSISIDFSNSQSLAEKLIGYELDVAVIGRIKTKPDFYAIPFSNPPLVVIAPRIPPWVGRHSVSIPELRKETIVRREPGSAARVAQDRLFVQAKIVPSRIIQCSGREGIVSAVAARIGIGTIFDEGVLPEDRIVKLKIQGPPIQSKVDIVCLADRKSNKLIASFLKVARDMLNETKQ
jgi:aminoethylphosphonate catabolism LysR family transcriptional regulator